MGWYQRRVHGVARKCDLSGRQTFRMTAVRKTTSQDGNYQEDSAQEAATGKCVRIDVRKTNGIRFKGINQQDLRKRLGCQQEWNKPGRLRTTPGAENTLQDVKIFTENGKGYA